MLVRQIIAVLESIAPPRYASEWDNVGLLIGSSSWEATRMLLTIDLTDAVLDEAIEHEVSMIVAYHPIIFHPLKTLTDARAPERIALRAATHRIAVYSPHTALDAAPGGVNDWLAEGLGEGDVRALEPALDQPRTQAHKVVTYCPADAADAIRKGLATVGAGQIGDYQLCSFELEGTGTFHGGAGTNPTVGRRGSLVRVKETRLEMVCPSSALALVVLTLKKFHPYEEPPLEIYRLQPQPLRNTGEGRRVVLDRKSTLSQLVERLKKHLGVPQLRVAPARKGQRQYQTIGMCAGAGASLLPAAIEQRCDLYLTGELSHHEVLAAQAAGCTVVLAGHTNTERGYLKRLRKTLTQRLPEVKTTIARRDGDPLQAV